MVNKLLQYNTKVQCAQLNDITDNGIKSVYLINSLKSIGNITASTTKSLFGKCNQISLAQSDRITTVLKKGVTSPLFLKRTTHIEVENKPLLHLSSADLYSLIVLDKTTKASIKIS